MNTHCPSLDKLPIEYINKLWNILYESPANIHDSQYLFKFLKEIAPDLKTVISLKLIFLVFKEF